MRDGMGTTLRHQVSCASEKVDVLSDPGTPPVAESTVGIARTPKAMIVFNMMMVALILIGGMCPRFHQLMCCPSRRITLKT
jgi:hypothetical protein